MLPPIASDSRFDCVCDAGYYFDEVQLYFDGNKPTLV